MPGPPPVEGIESVEAFINKRLTVEENRTIFDIFVFCTALKISRAFLPGPEKP